MYKKLSQEVEHIATKIVDAAYTVHVNLGPGLLEKIYESCFCIELTKRDLIFRRQVHLPIYYNNVLLNEGIRLDIIVEDRIICEIKAVEILNTLHEAQLLTYLKLSNKRLGFLINFNTVLIKNGIKRLIL